MRNVNVVNRILRGDWGWLWPPWLRPSKGLIGDGVAAVGRAAVYLPGGHILSRGIATCYVRSGRPRHCSLTDDHVSGTDDSCITVYIFPTSAPLLITIDHTGSPTCEHAQKRNDDGKKQISTRPCYASNKCV